MMNPEETLSTISAMYQQEAKYLVSDYLSQSSSTGSVSANNGPLHMVDVECRSKMVAWCYQVVDFCKFQRETVSIAVNYLDRFMATPASIAAKADRKIFQLVAMTCLYTAVKIHEPEAMDPKLVSTLSRGTYSPEEVERMEATILGALGWRMNPPTALAFVRLFLDLLPANLLGAAERETVYELSKFQTELTVSEYDFLAVRPSVVAYSALINAIESVGLNEKTMAQISYGLSETVRIDMHADKIFEVQNWLYQAVSTQPAKVVRQTPVVAPAKSSAARRSSFDVSPRSVAAQ